MDLGTIKKKLRWNVYKSGNDCIRDLFSMLKNCYIYNRPGDWVIGSALELEQTIRDKLRDLPYPEETEIVPKNHLSLTISGDSKRLTNNLIEHCRKLLKSLCSELFEVN